jgi:hypothetical protein
MGEQDSFNGWTYKMQYPLPMEKEEKERRDKDRECVNISMLTGLH